MESYKSGQGSLARLMAAVCVLVALVMGCIELYSWIQSPRSDSPLIPGVALFADMPVFGGPMSWKFLLCVAIFAAGLVLMRRYLGRPGTVDALIETEQEMKKVSWPTRDESLNATWIVVLVSVLLTASLWFFDLILGSLARFVF